MKEIENINRTKKLLEDWEKSRSLEEKIRIYETISLYSVFLAENLSQMKEDYNVSYYRRRIEVSKSFLNNRRDKIAETTAMKQAEEDNEELIMKELENESLAVRMDNFLKQINKAMDMMRTVISYERSEKERILPNEI